MIRKAEKSDIPRILELLVQVDMVHHEGRPDLFKGPATKYDKGELEDIIENESEIIFVFTGEDGNVKGHAFCSLVEQAETHVTRGIKTLYIDDICVDENARGRNIGRALFEHAADFARSAGCYNVTLNVWECNGGARRFYEKMGMKAQKTVMESVL